VITTFLSAARTVAPLLHSAELAESWAKPSALAEFRVSGLAGHLAGQVGNVTRFLDVPVPADQPVMEAVRYYSQHGDEVDVYSENNTRIRVLSEEFAGPSAAELAARYDASVETVAARLDGLADDRLVLMFNRWVLPLDQCLLTRIIELVVHADDLAVSLGVPTPEFSDDVVEATVTTLARISVAKRGQLPVLRALSRRERADGAVSAF
jgi:uncharacterized protein (TIGR03083 family)